jgi:RNA polymerase sigma factor (sigma-70 family)
MITTEAMHTMELNDAGLVAESLGGNREAFRQIVERYQTLITSLAYCATGNVSQSEDLAQQTFVSAWKQLAELREPDKLRPWLCSIARFLISKEFRRLGREPAHAAESLEAVDEWVSPEPLPPDHAISEEEKAILWRSLERIPEIYREPLVLFYREHQSIEAVARDLGLSEDAVKQRLSRGRKLLQEQFLAFVAGALKQTTPGKTFTLGVIAALPLLAATAKAATATATATKSGAVAKATGAGAFLQTLAALSPILLLGGFFGFKMGGDARRSSQQRESVVMFWRIVVGSLAAFVVLPFLVLMIINFLPVDFSGDFRQRVMNGMTIWLGLMYAVVPAALILWAWQRRRKFRSQPAWEPEIAVNPGRKKRLVLWVTIATIGTACLLVLVLSDTNKKVQHITAAEVQQMVADSTGKEIQFSVTQYQNGNSDFFITLRENGRRVLFSAPVDDATLAMIKEQGIQCPTYVQGRDFEIFGWPGKLLPVFCIFILAIGIVVLLRRPGKFNPQEMDAQQAIKLQQSERVGNKVFGTVVALAMIGLSLLILLFTLAHQTFSKSVSSVAAQKVILEHKDARFEVFQNDDGSKELFITPPNSRHYPGFIAPADDATLALLAENKLAYKTYVQGRDFGYRDPSPWILWPCIILLPIGAVFLLRRAWKKDSLLPTSVQSNF